MQYSADMLKNAVMKVVKEYTAKLSQYALIRITDPAVDEAKQKEIGNF